MGIAGHLSAVASSYLAGVLVVAGLGKVKEPGPLRRTLRFTATDLRFPDGVASRVDSGAAVGAVVTAELLVAGLLVMPQTLVGWWPPLFASALFSTFLLVLVSLKRSETPCGCFGESEKNVGLRALIQTGSFALLALLLLVGSVSGVEGTRAGAAHILLGAVLALMTTKGGQALRWAVGYQNQRAMESLADRIHGEAKETAYYSRRGLLARAGGMTGGLLSMAVLGPLSPMLRVPRLVVDSPGGGNGLRRPVRLIFGPTHRTMVIPIPVPASGKSTLTELLLIEQGHDEVVLQLPEASVQVRIWREGGLIRFEGGVDGDPPLVSAHIGPVGNEWLTLPLAHCGTCDILGVGAQIAACACCAAPQCAGPLTCGYCTAPASDALGAVVCEYVCGVDLHPPDERHDCERACDSLRAMYNYALLSEPCDFCTCCYPKVPCQFPADRPTVESGDCMCWCNKPFRLF